MSDTRHHRDRQRRREYVSARLRGYPCASRFNKDRTHRLDRRHGRAIVAAEVEAIGDDHVPLSAADQDDDATWTRALDLLRAEGHDVEALLARAAANVRAWHGHPSVDSTYPRSR